MDFMWLFERPGADRMSPFIKVVLFVTLFLLRRTSASLEQLSDCFLISEVFPLLSPSLIVCVGRVCKPLNLASEKALRLFFTKQGILDVELLYDIYQHYSKDLYEKQDLKRYIEANYPDVKGGLAAQLRYEQAKSVLFSGNEVIYFPALSEEYPEISRMLVKYKHEQRSPSNMPTDAFHHSMIDSLLQREEPMVFPF